VQKTNRSHYQSELLHCRPSTTPLHFRTVQCLWCLYGLYPWLLHLQRNSATVYRVRQKSKMSCSSFSANAGWHVIKWRPPPRGFPIVTVAVRQTGVKWWQQYMGCLYYFLQCGQEDFVCYLVLVFSEMGKMESIVTCIISPVTWDVDASAIYSDELHITQFCTQLLIALANSKFC